MASMDPIYPRSVGLAVFGPIEPKRGRPKREMVGAAKTRNGGGMECETRNTKRGRPKREMVGAAKTRNGGGDGM